MANKKRKVKKRSTIFLIYFLFIFNLFTGPVRAQTTTTEEIITPIEQQPKEILKAEATDIIADLQIDDNTIIYAYTTTLVENESFEILEKRTQNTKHFSLGDNRYNLRVYNSNYFYENPSDGLWYNVEYATSTKSTFDYWTIEVVELLSKNNSWWWLKTPFAYAQTSSIGLDTAYGTLWANDVSWSTVYSKADAEYSDVTLIAAGCYLTAGQYYIYRGYTVFDYTGEIEPSDITDAEISIYFFQKFDDDNDAFDYLEWYEGTQNSIVSPPVLADYNNYNSTALSDQKDITSLSTTAYTDFTLNESALTLLQATTTPKFVLREGHEINNNACGASFTRMTANIAYLNLTYTIPEEEPATTTDPHIMDLLTYNDISIISGYAEEYTDSSTTPSKMIHYVFHIPFFVYLSLWLLISFIFGRLVLEVIIQLRK